MTREPIASLDAEVSRALQRRLTGVHPAIRKVVAGMVDDMRPLLSEMFANVDDYFFARAERADGDHHHTFFDAMRTIRSGREGTTVAFMRNIFDRAAELRGRDSDARPPSPVEGASRPRLYSAETMSVLSEEEMELSVAASGIVQKTKSLYGREMETLTETLNGICGQPASDRVNHPLGTASLTQAFIHAIRPLGLELPVTLALLKLFERHVADRLGSVYAAALARLEQHGIRIRHASPRVAPTHGARDGSGTGRGTARFSELQGYLARGSGQGVAPSPGGPPPEEGAGLDELIHAVSSVQHRYLQHISGPPGNAAAYPNLQTFLLSLPASEGGFKNAGKDQQDTLRLVSDLFEHMFRNENLSVASKALIARMQFPILKTALADQSLFSDSDHPARQLLNRIAIDGIGWPPSEALLKRNALYCAGESIVARLNDAHKPDVDTFSQFLNEWTELVSKHQRRTRTAIRRLNETSLGKAKIEAARMIVQTAINDRAAGRELPGCVTAFISGDWTQAMVVACVKHGAEGDAWRQLCTTLDDLVRLADPSRPTAVEATAIESTREELLTRIRDALRRYGSPESAAAESLRLLSQALQRVDAPSTVGYEVEDLEIMEEIQLTEVEPQDEPELAGEDHRLLQLQPGSWVEIVEDDAQRPLRCQLAVAVEDTGSYVFNDDIGLKARELSRRELLAGMASDRIRIVHEESIVERAIDELIAKLQSYSPIHSGNAQPANAR